MIKILIKYANQIHITGSISDVVYYHRFLIYIIKIYTVNAYLSIFKMQEQIKMQLQEVNNSLKALSLQFFTIQELIQKLQFYEKIRAYDKAQLFYSNLIRRQPNNPDHYLRRSRHYTKRYMFHEARELLKKGIECNPLNKELFHYEIGRLFRFNYNQNIALEHFDLAISLNHKYQDALYEKAKFHRKRYEWNQGIEAIQACLELNPKKLKYSLLLTFFRMHQKIVENSQDEILADVNATIKNNSYEAYFFQGLICRWLRYHEKAQTNYQKALDLCPASKIYERAEIIGSYVPSLVAMSKYKAAIKFQSQLKQTYVTQKDYHQLCKGQYYAKLANYEKAEAILKKGQQVLKDNMTPIFLIEIMHLYYSLKIFQKCIQIYDLHHKIIDNQPQLAVDYLRIMSYHRLKCSEKSISVIRKAIERDLLHIYANSQIFNEITSVCYEYKLIKEMKRCVNVAVETYKIWSNKYQPERIRFIWNQVNDNINKLEKLQNSKKKIIQTIDLQTLNDKTPLFYI